MDFLNTNGHYIMLVTGRGTDAEQRHRFGPGAEFGATGELAEVAGDTNGVVRANSKEAAAYHRDHKVAAVAGSGVSEAASAGFDPGDLTADEAIDVVDRVTSLGELEKIAKAESSGKDRKTVNAAIEDRRETLAESGTTTTKTVPSKR